jgi:outer membrane protein TolC
MRRFYLILLFPLILPSLLQAQQNQTQQKFTLEECIQYALQNSVNAKNTLLDEEIADNVVKERRSEGLPQISGNVSLRHNHKLPPAFFKREVAYGFSPGEKNDATLAQYMSDMRNAEIVTQPNFFQLQSSGDASVTVNQLIFNSAYFLGLKAMKTYRELASRTSDQTREQIIVNVAKAYYGVLINNDRLELFETNINRVDSLLKNTQALNANGFAEEIDVDRITVTLNNLKSERDKFYNLKELGIQLLKFQMNYPMDQPVEVIGDLSKLKVDENELNNYTSNWNYDQRVDYKILETNFKLQELDIKAKQARSVPTLNAYYNLGYTTQSSDIAGLFRTNSVIPQGDAYASFGTDKWYQYSNYGVTLHVPLFSGFQQHANVQQAKLNQAKLQNSFSLLKSSIDLETKQASINYLNATKSLKSQEENKVLAEKIARITKIKYEQGVGSNLEVIDAESSLKETQVNFYNALYDALIAKVDLDKAYGKIAPPVTEEKK